MLFLPGIIADPNAQLRVSLTNVPAEMPTFSGKDAPLIAITHTDVTGIINLIEKLGVKRMFNTWHNLFTHPFCQFVMQPAHLTFLITRQHNAVHVGGFKTLLNFRHIERILIKYFA